MSKKGTRKLQLLRGERRRVWLFLRTDFGLQISLVVTEARKFKKSLLNASSGRHYVEKILEKAVFPEKITGKKWPFLPKNFANFLPTLMWQKKLKKSFFQKKGSHNVQPNKRRSSYQQAEITLSRGQTLSQESQ